MENLSLGGAVSVSYVLIFANFGECWELPHPNHDKALNLFWKLVDNQLRLK